MATGLCYVYVGENEWEGGALVALSMNLKPWIFCRMADRRRPKKGPRSCVVLQYRKAKPYERGTKFKVEKIDISMFSNYVELQLYLLRRCGGGYRTYPGGADYPVITYTKYKEDDNERDLNSETWDIFAASVSYILIDRKEA